MGGSHSSKFTIQYYLGLSSEEQVQALEVWDKISKNIPFHNEKIMQRFYGAYPEYRKYFIAATKCNASKLCEHPRVIKHWRQIIETLGFILSGGNYKIKCIEDHLSYVALCHKDMNLNMDDFEKYTTVFIAYLNQEIYLSPTVEGQWTTLMNSIFRIICNKMEKFRMMETEKDLQGNETILTPETIKIRPARENASGFWRCKSVSHSCLDFALPKAYNYHNKEYWGERKEFWLQQIYWFNKEADEYIERLLNEKMSARLSSFDQDDGKSHSHSTSHFSVSLDTSRPVYVLNEDALSNELNLIEKPLNEHFNTGFTLSSLVNQKEKKDKLKKSLKYKNSDATSKDSITQSLYSSDKSTKLETVIKAPDITSSMVGFLKDIEDEIKTESLKNGYDQVLVSKNITYESKSNVESNEVAIQKSSVRMGSSFQSISSNTKRKTEDNIYKYEKLNTEARKRRRQKKEKSYK